METLNALFIKIFRLLLSTMLHPLVIYILLTLFNIGLIYGVFKLIQKAKEQMDGLSKTIALLILVTFLIFSTLYLIWFIGIHFPTYKILLRARG